MDWEFSRWIFVSRPCLPKNTVQKLGRIKHWCVLPCSFHGFDGLVRYQERRPALVPIQVSLIVVGEILWFLTCHQNGWEMEQKSLQKNTPFFHTQFFSSPWLPLVIPPLSNHLSKHWCSRNDQTKPPFWPISRWSVWKKPCVLFFLVGWERDYLQYLAICIPNSSTNHLFMSFIHLYPHMFA